MTMQTVIKHILVVDNEPYITQGIRRHLRRENFAVECANSGDEGRNVILKSDSPFDLVITDIVMPNGDGFELIHWLHATYPEIPVLVITGLDINEQIRKTLRPDIDTFCQKPLSPSGLLEKINLIAQSRKSAGHADP